MLRLAQDRRHWAQHTKACGLATPAPTVLRGLDQWRAPFCEMALAAFAPMDGHEHDVQDVYFAVIVQVIGWIVAGIANSGLPEAGH
jgi:hypothetical protein